MISWYNNVWWEIVLILFLYEGLTNNISYIGIKSMLISALIKAVRILSATIKVVTEIINLARAAKEVYDGIILSIKELSPEVEGEAHINKGMSLENVFTNTYKEKLFSNNVVEAKGAYAGPALA